jgi:hypothetical protein
MLRTSSSSKARDVSRRLKTTTRTFAALSVIGLAVLPAAAVNLLTNPGFESGPGSLFPGGINIIVSTNGSSPYTSGYTTGVWGAENGAVISSSPFATVPPPTPQVIVPNSGKFMLDMVGASTGSFTQAWQLVDVSASLAAINTGSVTADMSAFFNAPFFVQSTGLGSQPDAAVFIQFFPASYLINNQQLNVPGVPATGASQIIPTNTWTSVGITNIPVPIGTSYILAQVAFQNASLTNPNNIDYDGYVDDANLTLNNIPEPASIGLSVIPAIAALATRRRKLA